MTYHLHTEDKGNLNEIVYRHFDGWTISYAEGFWKGQSEPTAIIELATDDDVKVHALAEDIKRTNHQQAVLVESFPSTKELV